MALVTGEHSKVAHPHGSRSYQVPAGEKAGT